MQFPILKYKNSINFREQQIAKLYEELIELRDSKTKENEIEECLDIIQICLSLILKHPKITIKKMFKFHNKKLISRGWINVGRIALNFKNDTLK